MFIREYLLFLAYNKKVIGTLKKSSPKPWVVNLKMEIFKC